MNTPRPESIPAVLLAGRYLLGAPLGAGGMGMVARERFRRRALAAAALDHPYICQIHELDEPLRGRAMVQAALEDFMWLQMPLHAELAKRFLRGGGASS